MKAEMFATIATVMINVAVASPTALPSPSKQQLEWLDQELGVIFHYTMYTFVSRPAPGGAPYRQHQDCGEVFNSDLKELPHPSTFNPTEGNNTFVDQWMQAAKAYGAKFVILTAKHCDGFITFPTKATFADGSPYAYGVQQSTWRNGKGDLVMDFVQSARRNGLTPGLYYNLCGNFYTTTGPITAQGQRQVTVGEHYNIVLTHVQELWSNYGDLGELWFDADPYCGNHTLQQRIAELTASLQPNAILLQGPTPHNGFRKGDAETATVFDPNWYTCQNTTACKLVHSPTHLGGTGPFIPSEAIGCAVGDGDSRQWFWHPDHDEHAALKNVSMFWDEYHHSVGLGSNQLMGFTADRRGLIPSNDVEKVAEVGQRIKRCYGNALAKVTSKQLSNSQDFIDLQINTGTVIDRVWLREDISSGQRAQEFRVLAQMNGTGDFVLVGNGTSIARKRIVIFREEIKPVALRVQVTASLDWPVPIYEFAAFASCSNLEKEVLV